jgi:hypothetical protein
MRHVAAPSLTVLALAVLAACGQPFLSARVEIPDIRIVSAPQDFPAVSFDPSFACSILGQLSPQNCSAQTLDPIDIGDALDQKGVTSELRLKELVLRLGDGGDARGIRRVELDFIDPVTATTTMIASYHRPEGISTPITTVAIQSSNLNLADYLQSGKLQPHIEVELDPIFIATGFSASIETAFSVKVTVNYRDL